MVGSAIGCIITVVLIKEASTQNIPEECKREPPSFVERPLDCCRIPKIYKEEDVLECAPHLFRNPTAPSTPPSAPQQAASGLQPPHQPPPCEIHMCVLKKNNLLNEDSSLHYERISQYLDEYAATDRDARLSFAVGEVKARCIGGDLSPFGPPHMCEALKLGVCTSAVLFSECPSWETSEGCAQVKEYVDKCKAFMFEVEPTTEEP